MNLDLLPTRNASAAENMAVDFLLLQRYPDATAPRFRHYGWHRPAFTFGYSQKIAFVRTVLPQDGPFDLCRRPTGGGLVDHRDDWTYALVIPRGHPLEELRATQSYREVHACLAETLRLQGVPAVTKPVDSSAESGTRSTTAGTPSEAPALEGICFEHAEFHDVVHATSGKKIAGAAQKRNKRGLLFQGSIWRPAAGPGVDWDRFQEDFTRQLAATLGAQTAPAPWPEYNEDEVNGLVDQYSSPEWTDHR
jgi:lipoate-protein ligase A